jgi:ATP-dependent DNA helicase DinG
VQDVPAVRGQADLGARVERVFADDGPLTRAVPEFEPRPGQRDMAAAVARVFGRGGILLAEAGTGTGKTLAYLTAVADAGVRTVVSTGTRNLQDQLLGQDVPLLERALGRSLSAVSLKGLGNYLCRRRLDLLRREGPLLDRREGAILDRILRWAEVTRTGDRAELSDLPESVPLWGEVCASYETRLGLRCPEHDACFVTRARRAAQDARIVIVNHHLFFADLALRSSAAALLPAYDAVVFDEAHQLDEIATAFFGVRVGSRQIETIARDCRRALAACTDLAEGLRAGAAPLIDELAAMGQAFFATLAVPAGPGAEARGRVQLRPEDLAGPPERSYFRLDGALEALAAHLGGLPTRDEAVVGCGRRAEALRADLGEILGQQRPASVHWIERGARDRAVGASPIDVSEVFREMIVYPVETVVLTSATLTVDGSFAYVRERLGLGPDVDAQELVLDSPFDFERQVALFLPRDAPDPRNPGALERLADLLIGTISVVEGGSLVLFTSLRDMERVAALVRAGLDRPVRVQGERPRQALLDELRAADAREPTVLLATASFWEGVDVPGDALQLVAIARLPFSVPSDPVVAARLRRLEEDGRNPFVEYQIPQASLSLKQGFGRLIRSRRDRGVVALLDKRLQTMGYGKIFLRTLPSCTVIDHLDELRRWWEGGCRL